MRRFLPANCAELPLSAEDAAEVFVGGPDVAGRLVFRDELRPEAAGTIRLLHAANVRTIMLTGDRAATAEPLARALGIGEMRAGLLPEDKLAAVQSLKAGGTHRVAMIGDGVNDAPSLAAADVSVAMGARGSDTALEQAAVVLMNDRLENFFVAYELSRRTERVIRQNLFIALGTVVLMVGCSLFGVVPLALGVAAHEAARCSSCSTACACCLRVRRTRARHRATRARARVFFLFHLPTPFMNSARFLFAAVALQLIAMPVYSHAQQRPPASILVPPEPSKVPPFLKVDGMYVLDGNDDDLVKVAEISDTGWMRVQTKTGESWVNISSLTTVTPISKEQAAKSELHAKADFILDGAQQISDAIDAYAAKNNLPPTASFKWADIRKFIKPGTPIYDSNGKDVSGRAYEFGAKISDHVKVNAETIKELSPAIEDPDTYWGKFK